MKFAEFSKTTFAPIRPTLVESHNNDQKFEDSFKVQFSWEWPRFVCMQNRAAFAYEIRQFFVQKINNLIVTVYCICYFYKNVQFVFFKYGSHSHLTNFIVR